MRREGKMSPPFNYSSTAYQTKVPLFVCCSSLLLQCSALSDQTVCSYCFGMEKSKGSPFCKEGLWKGSLFFHQSCWKPSFPSLFPSPAPKKLTSSCLCQGSVRFDTFAVRYRNANGEIQQHLIRGCKHSVNLICGFKNKKALLLTHPRNAFDAF